MNKVFILSVFCVITLLGEDNDGLLSLFHQDASIADPLIVSRFPRKDIGKKNPILIPELKAEIGKHLSPEEHIRFIQILGPKEVRNQLLTRFNNGRPKWELLKFLEKALEKEELQPEIKKEMKKFYDYYYPDENIKFQIQGLKDIFSAVRLYNEDSLKQLIDAGIDVNVINKSKNTPLNNALTVVEYAYPEEEKEAIYKKQLKIVNHLIKAGADIHGNPAQTMSPLTLASFLGNAPIVKLLIEAEVNVNSQNEYGKTALHLAALSGNPEIIKLLIEAEADVNISDSKGSTPLHIAAYRGYPEITNILIEAGADVFARDNNGKRPEDLVLAVRRRQHVENILGRRE